VKKLAPAWVLGSVGIAIALWFLATAVEIRLQTPDEAPPPDSAVEQERLEDTRLDSGAAASMSCMESEERLKGVIAGARSCNADDDCTLFDYGYPLDCMTSVAKSQIPLLRDEYRQYDESCDFRVFYDCPTEPYVRLALCRNHRCVVELDKRDDLEDSTLDQINRRQPGPTPRE
jgi:hypothetical protein